MYVVKWLCVENWGFVVVQFKLLLCVCNEIRDVCVVCCGVGSKGEEEQHGG